jgi:hypothetical protein
MFQVAIEAILAILLGWTLVTQVALPLIRGTRLFPLFRTDLSQASEAVIDAQSRVEVTELEKRAEEINASVKPTPKTTKGKAK